MLRRAIPTKVADRRLRHPRLNDIRSVTRFYNHSAAFLDHVHETKRPLILTVLQDAESHQRLLDIAAEASAAEGVRQGLDDLAAGRTRPAAEVFSEIHIRHGAQAPLT